VTASLRTRLTLSTCAVVAVSLLAFAFGLYAVVASVLWRQFDERLVNDARAFAKMVEEQAQPPWEFEPGLTDEFEREREPAYFEVWMDDGAVVARSAALHGGDLVAGARALPDGRPGRTYEAQLPPRPDSEHPVPPSGRLLRVVVARSTVEVDGALALLRVLLSGGAAVTLLLAALAAAFAVRRGLAPLATLSAKVESLGAESLAERLPVAALPAELEPAVTRLNALLGRLEQAFKRERQLAADASHELRTPLAGLRSVLEVAVSRERSAPEYAEAMREALQVVAQLQVLIEGLLLLARLGGGRDPAASEEVPLKPLVDACFAPLAQRAAARRLTFENRVAEGARLAADPAKLRIVVGNLLGNAVDYTQEGGRVTVTSGLPGGPVLDVADSGPQIPPESLDAIFDPFVRLDASRTETGLHTGIGLSLVRAACSALGLTVHATNTADGQVAFVVER
jgi:two-component system heavy metal sensor histidine kinase CusS